MLNNEHEPLCGIYMGVEEIGVYGELWGRTGNETAFEEQVTI